jgi:ATP-binding cassette subfamily B protein
LIGAIIASTINKVADVVPELLIGAAVDVVVRGQDSFTASVLGVESVMANWPGSPSSTPSSGSSSQRANIAAVLWRGLARASSTTCASRPMTRPAPRPQLAENTATGTTVATLNDDVSQPALPRHWCPTILQTALNVILVGAVFACASWQLWLLAFLPIRSSSSGRWSSSGDWNRSMTSCALARPTCRCPRRQLLRDRDDQGLHGRAAGRARVEEPPRR